MTNELTATSADRQAIVELLNTYSDAVNQRDYGTIRRMWSDDGRWELGEPINVLKLGVDDIMTELQKTVDSLRLFVQMPHCPVVLSIDGDRARSRVTLNEVAAFADAAKGGMFIYATYDDELVRRDTGWKFQTRTYRVLLFDTAVPHGQIFSVSAHG